MAAKSKTQSSKRQGGGGGGGNGGAAVEVKKNPFEERSNKREKHPALNRKIMGANRNVGQARSKAQERREATLLPEFRARHASSQIEDRRFGERNQALTREEKMLKRFQALRTNKAQKYSLGDDDGEGGGGDSMTHLGQSLSDLLDNDGEEGGGRGGDNDEDDEEEDVDELVERLRSGETFSGQDKRQLTKREAMMDVIRKSKMLKMERQKDKEEDEDERDRLDAMTSSLVTNLAFRPTKSSAEGAAAAAAPGRADAYDKMVRELTLNPRVQATDRTKSEEELAKEERERLEALEEKRIKRMADESDGEEGDGEDKDGKGDSDDDDKDGPGGRKRRKRAQLDHQLEREIQANVAGEDVPFLIECPKSHVELLEFLDSYPDADLDQVLVRIRTTNSIHLQAGNRQKLIKLCQVLVDHLMLVGDRTVQQAKYLDSGGVRDLGVVCKHVFALIPLAEKECASMFLAKLDKARKLFELQLRAVKWSATEDLGKENAQLAARPQQQKMPGGHKDGLAQQLNAGLEHLAKMRRDHELSSSTTRVWPTGGEFALLGAISALFSTTDYKHPVATPCALYLGQVLAEAPVRGSGDVLCALQCAQLLEKITRADGNSSGGRFSPELFCFLRVVLGQLSSNSTSSTSTAASSLRQLDHTGRAHAAFDFIRRPKTGGGGAAAAPLLQRAPQSGEAFLSALAELLDNVAAYSLNASSSAALPSTDALVQPLVDAAAAFSAKQHVPSVLQPALDKLKTALHKCKTTRQKLRLQEFAPVVKAASLDPKLGTNTRPGEVERSLKRKVKEERKGMTRELRLDGQFLANASQQDKASKLNAARQARQRNFADLQTQQAQFNQMVKSGFAVKGAGVGGLNLKGRRMGKKTMDDDGGD